MSNEICFAVLFLMIIIYNIYIFMSRTPVVIINGTATKIFKLCDRNDIPISINSMIVDINSIIDMFIKSEHVELSDYVNALYLLQILKLLKHKKFVYVYGNYSKINPATNSKIKAIGKQYYYENITYGDYINCNFGLNTLKHYIKELLSIQGMYGATIINNNNSEFIKFFDYLDSNVSEPHKKLNQNIKSFIKLEISKSYK